MAISLWFFFLISMDTTKIKYLQPIEIHICFKIKNPPTVHSTSKIQPTTSPTFVFGMSASVRKKWGYERKLLDSRFGRSSSCFLFSHFIISLKKYDMVAKTFVYIIIIFSSNVGKLRHYPAALIMLKCHFIVMASNELTSGR
jgi:hypothetical protein